MAKKNTEKKPKKKKHPGGRPTKYKPENAEQVYKLSREGFTDKKIAEFFKVGEKTVNNWKKKHPEFLQSLKTGKDEYDSDLVENSLAKRASGYQYKETTRTMSKEPDPNTGKAKIVTIKEVTKEVAPDPTSMIFWLKNRRPERWRDKQSMDLGFNAETLNAILSGLPDEYARDVREALGRLVPRK